MKVRYFEATDTLLIEFNDSEVWETVEINQNTYADYARDGQVVTLTLEHAR